MQNDEQPHWALPAVLYLLMVSIVLHVAMWLGLGGAPH
jgi:hypothetical protein